MAITREILRSHPVATLKKEISKTNVKGYSKMGKAELIELMMKHKERFGHIKMADKKARAKPDRQASQARKALAGAIASSDRSAQVRKTLNVKPTPKQRQEAVGLAQKITGKSKAELNKLDPAQLFGLLPVTLRTQILDPKQTGVKVAQKSLGQLMVENEKLSSKISDEKYDPTDTVSVSNAIEVAVLQSGEAKRNPLLYKLGLATPTGKLRNHIIRAYLKKYNDGEIEAEYKDLPQLLGNDLPKKLVETYFDILKLPKTMRAEVPKLKKELLDYFNKNLKERKELAASDWIVNRYKELQRKYPNAKITRELRDGRFDFRVDGKIVP